MLPTFPSRYWSTIGLPEVFSLAGWSPRIQTGFLVSRPTQVVSLYMSPCLYGGVTLCAAPFRVLPVQYIYSLDTPTTPQPPQRPRFGLCPVRSPLLRTSIFLSFPPGTKMFQFPGFAPSNDGDRSSTGRVAPFGHARINSCLRIPAPFRSLPRPSSPPEA